MQNVPPFFVELFGPPSQVKFQRIRSRKGGGGKRGGLYICQKDREVTEAVTSVELRSKMKLEVKFVISTSLGYESGEAMVMAIITADSYAFPLEIPSHNQPIILQLR